MNIALINSSRKWIGEAAHTFSLYEQLSSRGHRVIIICRQGWELQSRAMQKGLNVYAITMRGNFNGIDDLRDFWRLRRILIKENVELVHCHRGKDHLLSALTLLSLGRNIPLVRTRHVVVPVRQHVFNRWLYKRATQGIIAVSRKALESFGPLINQIPSDRLRVIYSSVDTNEFTPEKRSNQLRKSLGVRDSQLLVGLIARLQRIKGQKEFLQAAAQVSRQFDQAKFLICGSGSKERVERLKSLTDSLGIAKQTIFLGFQQEIATLIASLDIGVVASLGSEGSSRVTLEYMASGVPLVATTVGGIPELVDDGQTGILVPPARPDLMARAILKLLNSSDLRRQLSQQQRVRATGYFNHQRWTDEIEQFYQKIIGQSVA